jgi:hypothetical protein
MNVPPTKWGPHFWMALHIACLGCQDYKIIAGFVEGFKAVIPCLSCRMHFDSVLTENPVPEAGDFFKWSVDVHNIVNKRLGKPEFSYEEALANIVVPDVAVPNSPRFDFKIATIIFLMVVILVLIFNRK